MKSILSISRGVSRSGRTLLGASCVIALVAGCESPPSTSSASNSPPTAAASAGRLTEGAGRLEEIVTIHEGDVLKIAFPGTPQLDGTHQVRTNGEVTLDIVGEVKVAGQTPRELEKTLSQLYATQLISHEVTVIIVSSSFEVYVTGAVLRPGKIGTSKPITAFQAIMDAGYDPVNSNLAKVTLIRQVGRSNYTYMVLNLQLVLEGKVTEPFYLKPSDTLQVPKKISVFN